LWVLSTASIFVWTAFLPYTQSEQVNRRRVEADLRKGRIAESIQFMSQRERSDFPPHWDPPPRTAYGETEPSIVEVLLHLDQLDAAPWVQDLFREKLAVQASADPWNYYGHAIRLSDLDDQQLAHYAKILNSLPEGPAMARYHETEIQVLLDPQTYGEEPYPAGQGMSAERRSSLNAILSLIPDDPSQSDE
jgi:hypothetical protein